MIGAWTAGGFFRPARLLTSDASGHDYVLVMPPGTDFKLTLEGSGVDVMDAAGRKLEAGAAAPMRGTLEGAPGHPAVPVGARGEMNGRAPAAGRSMKDSQP